MSFTKVSRKQKSWTSITEVRYAVHATPTTVVGRVSLPPSLVTALGWTHAQTLDVMIGTSETDDEGWFALTPFTDKHRARFSVRRNGVGRYTSNALVPKGVVSPQPTCTPASRIEGDTLYLKLGT